MSTLNEFFEEGERIIKCEECMDCGELRDRDTLHNCSICGVEVSSVCCSDGFICAACLGGDEIKERF